MDIKQHTLKETFQSAYSNKKFLRFIKEFFKDVTYIDRYFRFSNEYKKNNDSIESYNEIAMYQDEMHNRIGIYAVELNRGKSVERARSLQRNFISKLLLESSYDAAIVAFYCKNESRWRLSFVRLDYTFADGKVSINLTPTKRYSYLVGKGEPCHTAQSQLYPIFKNDNYNPTLERIEEAFSIETVTKDFFEQYKKKYLEIKGYLDNCSFFLENGGKTFSSGQFTQKLMGQLSFLYFLQKKGWLGVKCVPDRISADEYQEIVSRGFNEESLIQRCYECCEEGYVLNYNYIRSNQINRWEANELAGYFESDRWGEGKRDFIRQLFNQCQEKGGNFYNDYLQPLFYEALNKNRGQNNYYKELNCKIPFLNGGLFEPLTLDKRIHLSNDFFSNQDSNGILDIFDRYNFTINEAEPLEKEVAVDPEMLGKIFENLLDDRERKEKGTFYTPREIVHYICTESLVNYLTKKVKIPYEDIKQFILYGDMMKESDCYTPSPEKDKLLIPDSVYNRLNDIDEALENIKIADPAVGSGAFPLGMLSEIVKIRSTITEYYIHQLQATNHDKEMLPSINKEKELIYKGREPYILKWKTIKNSIYAVDIEPTAVDISKLRLYLALVVDEELEIEQDTYCLGEKKQRNPQPLPNLDCNILCGNSLIDEFRGIKLFDESLLIRQKRKTRNFSVDSQLSLFGDKIDQFLRDLFQLQDRLFGEEDADKKIEIKNQINVLISCIITSKLTKEKDSNGLKIYAEIQSNKIKPYFLWKLEFARIFKENGGFDIVIGNPPYGAKFNDEEKEFLSTKYPSVPDFESSDYFIDMSRNILTENGILAFIVPNMFMANVYAKRYRQSLIENWSIIQIDNLSSVEVFDNATVRNVILYLEKSQADFESKMTSLTLSDNNVKILKEKVITKSEYEVLLDNWLNILDKSEEDFALAEKIKGKNKLLANLCEISQGLIPYDKYKGHTPDIIKNKIWDADFKKDDTYRRFIDGRDISRYSVKWNEKKWISYGDWLAAPRKKYFFTEERIIIREITNPYILAAYCKDEYYNRPSIINCVHFKEDIYYVLGIINSKLMTYYHLITSPKAKKGSFPKILVNDIRNLPIAIGDSTLKNLISQKVQEIIELKNTGCDLGVEKLDSEIDKLVYIIYGLNEGEIEFIEQYITAVKSSK